MCWQAKICVPSQQAWLYHKTATGSGFWHLTQVTSGCHISTHRALQQFMRGFSSSHSIVNIQSCLVGCKERGGGLTYSVTALTALRMTIMRLFVYLMQCKLFTWNNALFQLNNLFCVWQGCPIKGEQKLILYIPLFKEEGSINPCFMDSVRAHGF